MMADQRHMYQKIAWDIREQIRTGELRPETKIPSLNQLMETYKVSYATAQTAVALLRSWGLVPTEQGAGTFVLPGKPVVELMTSVLVAGTREAYSWRDTAAEFGVSGSQVIANTGLVMAPPDVADAFGYDADTPVTWRERHIKADGDTVQIAISYFAAEVAEAMPELGRPGRLRKWAAGLMAQAGWVVVMTSDMVTARLATDDEAVIFGFDVGSAVSEMFRTCSDASGSIIMIERNVSNSARIRQVWHSKPEG
mgnify:CR=1 FL=1